MKNYHFKIMRSRDNREKFFAKMGHFFASRKVRQETGGYPMNDSEKHLWMVAQEKRTFSIVGFVSMEEKEKQVVLHDFYIDPAHRSKGIMKTLLKKSLHYAGDMPVTATIPGKCWELFKALGFAVAGERGSWLKIERNTDGSV